MSELSDQHFKTEGAAKYLNISPKTLEALRVKGGGPAFAKLANGRKGTVIYRKQDLDSWVASKLVTSTSAATVAAA